MLNCPERATYLYRSLSFNWKTEVWRYVGNIWIVTLGGDQNRSFVLFVYIPFISIFLITIVYLCYQN